MTIITVIGAGSASFGENTLSAILRSKKLKGSTLRLVDRNTESLDIVHRLSNRINREWDAGFTISAHASHKDALSGADFVVSAIEVGAREKLWKSDFEIPIKYGVRQPYAENGGWVDLSMQRMLASYPNQLSNCAAILEVMHTKSINYLACLPRRTTPRAAAVLKDLKEP